MANLSLLTIVGKFYSSMGLGTPPATVEGSSDVTVLQILELIDEGLQGMAQGEWGSRFAEMEGFYAFTHQQLGATGVYGALNLETDAGIPDYGGMVQGTLYDVQTKLPVAGPYPLEAWNDNLLKGIALATYNYRISGQYLCIYPVPAVPASYFFRFYYHSQYVGLRAGVGIQQLVKDADVPKVPWRLVLADLRWRYKKEKEMAYMTEYNDCAAAIALHFNNHGNAGPVDAGSVPTEDLARPRLYIPPGNWPLA